MSQIHQNSSLKSFNTFGIEAIAASFISVSNEAELKDILLDDAYQNIKKLILGGGSNILLTQDFDGLVIKIDIKGIELLNEDEDHVYVKVGAGEVWHEFVMRCIEEGWAGVENLSLIPGTVGAAPMQNIGAYGVEIKSVFESLEAIDYNGESSSFSNQECQFGYRSSIFKTELKGKMIITSVVFRLNKTPSFNITYGAIKDTLEKNSITDLSLRAVSDAVIEIRQSKLPDPAEIGNAGSFFKNPEIPADQFEQLKEENPTIPSYPASDPDKIKVPAGWLIDQAGWKGFRDGDIGVHKNQALVLVNYGNGNGGDIKDLAFKVQADINEKYGILLHPEVNII